MSERITEAGLGELEVELARQAPEAVEREDPFVSVKLTRHLIAEVRRLRGLIVAGVGDVAWIDDLNDTGGWDALRAESEAIDAETQIR